MIDSFFKFALQPLLVTGALTFWYFNQTSPVGYPITVVTILVILGVAEHWWSRRRDWIQHWQERARNITIAVIVTFVAVFVVMFYDQAMREPLATLRTSLGLDIWPHHWPVLAQVFMVFFAKEFIWYWVHRSQHRWAPVWRASGHGAHHSFKRLGAINAGVNHPIELFFIVLPAALVEFFFGVGIAVAGAAILSVTLATIAHTNLDMNTRVIGWFFTTPRYHIHHHSQILEESNTNYGCSAIIWDRLFGTFRDADTAETGTGPTEPTLWRKFIMPVREAEDTAIAPQSS
jgi:sterol desaturase/sphingolipid hydroxylase (fatty acid hydroxylase superfamily)